MRTLPFSRRPRSLTRSGVVAALSLSAAMLLVSCDQGAAPTHPTQDALNGDIRAAHRPPQAGQSDVSYAATGGALTITISDPNGVGNYHVSAHEAPPNESATIEAIGPTGREIRHPCPQTRTIALGAGAHANHSHRVLWTDCQGRRNAGRGQVLTSETELWEMMDLDTRAFRVMEKPDLRPRIVEVVAHQHAFHAVIVGHSHNGTAFDLLPCEKRATDVTNVLKGQWPGDATGPGWGNLGAPIVQAAATRQAIADAVNAKKALVAGDPDGDGNAEGDDFLFYFCDHGNNGPGDAGVADEPDALDGRIGVAPNPNRPLDTGFTDDDLTALFSGFRAGAKITVVLDVCHAGDFVKGMADLLNIQDDRQTPLDFEHLAILMAARDCEPTLNAEFSAAVARCLGKGATTGTGSETPLADGQKGGSTGNRDGRTTAEELFNCTRSKTVRSNPTLARGVFRRT